MELLLAEAPLETVPRELWGHPTVYKVARRRGKPPGGILLDSSLHHQAMRRLADRERRGRPDIVHVTLLCVLEHPLAASGRVRVYIHTYGDYLIEVRPGTRLPRNYLRFTGLIEQLFDTGSVPPGAAEPLLKLRPASLERLLRGAQSLLIDPEAEEELTPREAAKLALEEGLKTVIPATPQATPSHRLRSLATRRAALQGLRRTEPWVAASTLLAALAEELQRRE